MQFKKILVWSIVNSKNHPELTEKERSVAVLARLISALFPRMTYSILNIDQIKSEFVMPALKKRFPKLQSVTAKELESEEMVEIEKFFPSKKYEWQDSKEWQLEFQKLLSA